MESRLSRLKDQNLVDILAETIYEVEREQLVERYWYLSSESIQKIGCSFGPNYSLLDNVRKKEFRKAAQGFLSLIVSFVEK